MIKSLVDDFSPHLLGPVIYGLEFYSRREEIYLWLINNGLVGKKLHQFFLEHSYSHLRIAQLVLSRIDKWKKSEIIVGKDIL